MTAEVLDGVRVVAAGSGRALGLACTVLADFGAEVIKIEPPAGDRFRDLPSAPMWLRGQQSVVIDLADAPGRETAHALVATADVAIVAAPPTRLRAWGLLPDQLLAANPTLVPCSITGWGLVGPLADVPGYEALVSAKAGRMAGFDVQLRQDRPVYSAVEVATHISSQAAVQGIVAALYARSQTGLGQCVETSLFQGLMPFDLIDAINVQRCRVDSTEFVSLRKRSEMPTLNYHPVRASDGVWLQCGNLLEHLFYSFLDALGLLGEMLGEDQFQASPAEWSAEAIEEARDRILLRTQEKTGAEWMSIFMENGNVAAEPVVTTDVAIDHPDLVEGGALITLDDTRHGSVRQIGPIAELTATPARIESGAPAVGADTDQIPKHLERSRPEPAQGRPVPSNPAPGRPLDGVTILDLSTIIAGPLGISMLADLGARVIKLEPFGGDPFRHLIPGGLMAVKTNAGKESICIDLKKPAGQNILHQLVAQSDVVVHNFRAGVPEKLGLGYDALKEIKPDLIWAVVNGYGPHGPSAPRPATHPVMGAAAGGVAYQAGDAVTRECGSVSDVREAARQIMAANDSNPDPNTSVVAASAILLALVARQRHGVGQRVNINMQVANAWANSDDFLAYETKPQRSPVDSELLGLGALYRLYRTDDGWVFLAAPSHSDFERLRQATKRSDLTIDDPDLVKKLTDMFATDAADAWESLLTDAGVGCVRADGIETGSVWCDHPQALANGWAPNVDHPRFGTFRRWGPLVTVGGLNPVYQTAPLAGEHTDAILGEIGQSEAQIAELRSSKVVTSE